MEQKSSVSLRRKSDLWSCCSFPVATRLLFLFGLLTFITQATGFEDSGMYMRRRRTQNSLESFESNSYRVFLSPFHLVLARTPKELDRAGIDDLFGVISSVLESYVQTQLEETSTTLQYIFLRDMESQFRNEQTTLSFPLGGIAMFLGSDIISSTQLDEWTQHALEVILPGVLRSGAAASSSLNEVQFSVYLVDRLSDEIPSIQNAQPPVKSDGKNNNILIIVISVAATLAIVVALALLASRYYGPKSLQDMDGTKESPSVRTAQEAASPSSDGPAVMHTLSGDDRSEGSFTVNTEAGDSTALKTIHHNLASTDPMETVEPFQHEATRLSVQKDMLASSWIEDKNALNLTIPPQMESVLAPSHFAASKEEQDRRIRMHQQIQAEAWDDAADLNESTIRFESAHEFDGDEEENKNAFLDSRATF